MSDINLEQLKEFFEFRARNNEQRMGKLEDAVEGIEKSVMGIAVKVNTIWKAVGFLGAGVATAVLKAVGVF